LAFKDPVVPIVANCTGEPMTKAEDVKTEIVSQICSCVQWKQSIDYMLGTGVSQFVEVGPGSALSSMVRRIDGSADTISVGDMDSIMLLKGG
jgi:[acyl-carrier-protein] S-malonyltransferase